MAGVFRDTASTHDVQRLHVSMKDETHPIFAIVLFDSGTHKYLFPSFTFASTAHSNLYSCSHSHLQIIIFDQRRYTNSPAEAIVDLENAIALDPMFTRAYMVVGHYQYLLVC